MTRRREPFVAEPFVAEPFVAEPFVAEPFVAEPFVAERSSPHTTTSIASRSSATRKCVARLDRFAPVSFARSLRAFGGGSSRALRPADVRVLAVVFVHHLAVPPGGEFQHRRMTS